MFSILTSLEAAAMPTATESFAAGIEVMKLGIDFMMSYWMFTVPIGAGLVVFLVKKSKRLLKVRG